MQIKKKKKNIENPNYKYRNETRTISKGRNIQGLVFQKKTVRFTKMNNLYINKITLIKGDVFQEQK